MFNKPKSSCGVALIVNLKNIANQKTVRDGLKVLSNFEYRAGFNPVTQESDGAGIRLYGFPKTFYHKKIQNDEFIPVNKKSLNNLILEPKQFIVGHYFLPPKQIREAQNLIETSVARAGLDVVGWRPAAINLGALSHMARSKMPEIWQAILIPQSQQHNIEHVALKASFEINSQAQRQRLEINILSQSAESIVYKGMVRPELMGEFYQDLTDPDMHASAVSLHARFATNTDPQWANAQPCPFFISHNGELNSARSNALEMRSEGIFADKNLSDSMQFDTDLASQIVMKNIELDEAVLRLMPPIPNEQTTKDEIAMLEYFKQMRTPYNGPAFMVTGFQNHFMAFLDQMGLRPSRWALIKYEDGLEQFHAASDDYISHDQDNNNYTVMQKGHIEPGGAILLTPQGTVLKTAEILSKVHQTYAADNPNEFQTRLNPIQKSVPDSPKKIKQSTPKLSYSDLNRRLYDAGLDYESADAIAHMAIHKSERLGAMGDDTNPLHTAAMPNHVSYFFHQLFAQVSAPPLDSIKERDRFSLAITLGAAIGVVQQPKQLVLKSPVLIPQNFEPLLTNQWITPRVLDLSFPMPSTGSPSDVTQILKQAIQALTQQAEALVRQGCNVMILSDQAGGPERGSIPDAIAVAAVRKHLEHQGLGRQVSLVADSYQIAGPHQAVLLLALGAKAVYPRGAYEKIEQLFPDNVEIHQHNFQAALEKCLLKTMGKMGITDVNNYINGHLVAALGLNLSKGPESTTQEPTLASIFAGIYSPLKGYNLSHIAKNIFIRHQQAYAEHHNFHVLPRSGFYMPEKEGIKHGFGPEVVNAFTDWLKSEEIRAQRWQLHTLLERQGYPGFIENLSEFSPQQGFLDPRQKIDGVYPAEYLATLQTSPDFQRMLETIDTYRQQHPTALKDYFRIKPETTDTHRDYETLESTASIRSKLFSGSMSQGALTTADPDKPWVLGAHEALTRGMNAIGAMSASGEGGEAPLDLRSQNSSTRSKQIASGRFGVSARQIRAAIEIEIKIAQGAKPGEGGELPGEKVTVRFAAQRGGLPGLNFISPPPHHDIYSIEDLEQLIHDIKRLNPGVEVAVKIVASEGIETIAIGVAKAGADIINIASHSGGTAAAQQSSIKHTGFPAELALVKIHQALIQTGLRDLVKLRVSGGLKAPEEVIILAILGADLFEFGTTAMLTLGCKMQRTCNHSCQPGVATDGHLFKGDQLNTERYFVNLAAAIHQQLDHLGVASIKHLQGRIDLLERTNVKLDAGFDLSVLLQKPKYPDSISEHAILNAIHLRNSKDKLNPKEELLIEKIEAHFQRHPSMTMLTFIPIKLDTSDRSFGLRIAGQFVKHLEAYPQAEIRIDTLGQAGQSFAAFMPKGMIIEHIGTVQDGCAKSMTGGELILKTSRERPEYRGDQNTIAGNALAYGASGGKIFVNGVAGHRFGVLLKGAEMVVEGVGDLAFEYMTSGTGMILGKAASGLCNSAMGGIVFLYDKHRTISHSDAVRGASPEEQAHYESAIINLLKAHAEKTGSLKAHEILSNFHINQFKVLIPKQLDLIATPRQVIDVLRTYFLSKAPFTCGMQVWLQQKINTVFHAETVSKLEKQELADLRLCLKDKSIADLFTKSLLEQLSQISINRERERFSIFKTVPAPKQEQPVKQRLNSIASGLDEVLDDALIHIDRYVAALSQDAQGCSGCRAQSCAGGDNVDTGCPSGKSINTINAILKRLYPLQPGMELSREQWQILRQAFEVQIESSPFIAYTGAACPAPCQDACTESIPTRGNADPKRAGKVTGEPVHIKNIEYYLFQIGRSFGWFDGNTPTAAKQFTHYLEAMKEFKPAFRQVRSPQPDDKELIIIGSGPAGMQLAFNALRDGIKVRMYEKSSQPGGLLANGIPVHKFDKRYIEEDFFRLKTMGLQLYLNTEVHFNAKTRDYTIQHQGKSLSIGNLNNEQQMIALCVGTGSPKTLPNHVIENLDKHQKQSIIQAVDFLQAANEVARQLSLNPSIEDDAREQLIKRHFQHMDPRGKKIVVVGGGDTAQDIIRWVARYFNHATDEHVQSDLNILVRGIEHQQRGILDGYPAPSRAPTKENQLRDEEVLYIQGKKQTLVQISKITPQPDSRLTLNIEQYALKYAQQIQIHPQLSFLLNKIPREQRPYEKALHKQVENVDLVICALGFSEAHGIPLANNIMIAGDASNVEAKIIVGAQANANRTWQQNKNMIRANPQPISNHLTMSH